MSDCCVYCPVKYLGGSKCKPVPCFERSVLIPNFCFVWERGGRWGGRTFLATLGPVQDRGRRWEGARRDGRVSRENDGVRKRNKLSESKRVGARGQRGEK